MRIVLGNLSLPQDDEYEDESEDESVDERSYDDDSEEWGMGSESNKEEPE